MTDAPERERPMDPHPAAASPIDPVVELAEMLIVTRRFRDADLTVEAAQAILAQVRERVHRALAGLPPSLWPPRVAPARMIDPDDVMRRVRSALRQMDTRLAPTPAPVEATAEIPPLDHLFAPEIVSRLRANGIEALTDFAKMTARQATDIPVIGSAKLAHIIGVMDNYGVAFKPYPPASGYEP